MTGLSQKVCYDFRRQISEKINRLPLAYFEKRTVGEVCLLYTSFGGPAAAGMITPLLEILRAAIQ